MSTPTRCETFEELMTPRKVMVGECNEDRISSLLDDVLCHILSFLPTKYSVRTSVLSTRWKQLYTFVPNLDFEYSPGAATSYNINFVHFVNSVFSSYNVSRMNKFSFTLWNEGPRPKYLPLFSWLSSALHRQVKEIEISFLLSQVPMALPLDLFSCKTLSMLTLEGHFYVVLPCSVSLPCLRICILLHVYFDDDSARRLFRSCLALEQLTLVCCHIKEGVKVFDISVPSLKRLIIHESGDNYQLVLNVPNLLFFEYVGPAANKFWGLGSLKSLVVARIFCEPDLSNRNDVVAKLVCSISHVQQLYLDRDVIEAFICSRHLLPRFNDLTRMEFSPISCFASRLLPDLLDNTPRLEFLEFEGFGEYDDDADKNSYVLPKHVPICVSLHLKEVEFKNFTGLDYDCKLIKYFLKYAKNLKVMKIQTELIWDEQFEISSAACQIVFYSDDLD